jgi:LCP family protein required for cell wall assembly
VSDGGSNTGAPNQLGETDGGIATEVDAPKEAIDLGSDLPSTPRRRWRNRKSRPPRSKRHRRIVRGAIAAGSVIFLIVGGAVGYTIYRNGQLTHIVVPHLVTPAAGSVENILLIGSTNRCALDSKQGGAFGLCANGVNGINSDVVMVLRLDGKKHRVSILSFPRDTFLPNARPGATNRIDSALFVGPGQLVKVIEDDFGIPINHFVELNFDSFQAVVKSMNGIEMYFPNKVKDQESGLKVLHTGCVRIGAFQALAVVRARHMSYLVGHQWKYDPTGDLGRIIRDHEFLRVLAGAVAKRGLGNPFADNALIGDLAPDLTVDTNFGIREMVDLVLTYRNVNPNAVPEMTLPIVVDPNNYRYKGYNYGQVVFPVQPQDQSAISAFLGTPVPGTHLAPSRVSVSVVGGSGNPQSTSTVALGLKSLGFKVTGTSEQPPVGPISETQVLYAGPSTLLQAQRVAASLLGPVAVGIGKPANGAQVVVVTGSNLRVRHAKLSSASSSVSVPAVTAAESGASIPATLVAAASSTTSALSAPTSSTSALPFYDPRACPVQKK